MEFSQISRTLCHVVQKMNNARVKIFLPHRRGDRLVAQILGDQPVAPTRLIGSILLLLSLFITPSMATPIPITFWHSMAGSLGIEVNKLAEGFNQSQQQYQVVPVYKGNYPETLVALVAAFRAGQQPDLVQVFEVGTAMMTNPPGAIVPVYKVMQQAGYKLEAKDFLPAVASYYSDDQGNMLALPFNSSTPVLFYNKKAFQKAGIDPETPPKTWPELRDDALKLLKAGYPCGFTTAWPSWIQLEGFSAWHNLPFASANNGFSSTDVKLLFNNPTVIHHVASFAEWQKSKIFVYGGREDNAVALFTSSQCPIIMESSGSLTDLTQDTGFPVGVGAIPYWPDVKGAPQNMLIGGAALWVMAGHTPETYKGVAAFLNYLSQPKIQAQFQQATGYLAVTKTANELSEKQGYYQKFPGAKIAIAELMQHAPTVNSKGIRLGAYPQIRNINDDALEAVFSGKETAKEALDQAVAKGNRALEQFRSNVAG